MTDRARRHLWISGRVQGVWFRESARAEADAHAVTGWVRNLPDGRVEAALEGDPAAVAAVEAWCRQGPLRARVFAVDARDEAPLGLTGPTGFEVR
jgi:acylphosphatase